MRCKWPVYALLQDAASQWPHRIAVYDDAGALSFLELFEQTEILRKALLVHGVCEGMGIGLRAKNGRGFIMGLFAAVGCGAVVMPVWHQLKKAEALALIEESGLSLILDDGSGLINFTEYEEPIALNIVRFSIIFTGNNTEKQFAAIVNQPAFIRFTSGTTGHSKAVVVSHNSVIERIEAANRALNLNCSDTVIWVLPMAFHFMVSIVLYIRYGAAIVVVDNFLAKDIITNCTRFGGTMLYASPMQIRLLANDTSATQMPTLKKVISTSAGISASVCADFKKRFNVTVSQAYGIIEIGLPIINLERSDEFPESVGYAVPGYDVAILDDDYKPVADGITGHLGIRGPGMFDAYLLPPALRNDVLKNGYFLTADYAYKNLDGLIIIAGRAKSVINISGMKVFPEEIEAFLETIPQIKHARVCSVPHPLMGQIIEADLILHDGASIEIDSIKSICRSQLSAYKVPQKIRFVNELPTTQTGKIIRG